MVKSKACAKIYFIILGLVALSAESEKDSERVSILMLKFKSEEGDEKEESKSLLVI